MDISNPNKKRSNLTKGINCLSWDCGTTNLCYCLLEYIGEPGKEFKIIMWENFSLNAQSIKHAVEMLPRELDRRPWMLDVDYICVESQVLKNIQMKVISHALQMYFITRTLIQPIKTRSINNKMDIIKVPRRPLTVHFIAAKSKFTVCNVTEPIHLKTRRARNKHVAVLMAQQLLKEQGDEQTLKYLNKHTKKDDLADSFIQAIYFLRIVYTRNKQTKRVLKHLGLDKENKIDQEGDIILNLNEGCEIDVEIPLPQVYKSDTFSNAIYTNESNDIKTSDIYDRSLIEPKWSI